MQPLIWFSDSHAAAAMPRKISKLLFFFLLSLKQSDLIWKTARDEITITFSFQQMRAYGLLSGSHSATQSFTCLFLISSAGKREEKKIQFISKFWLQKPLPSKKDPLCPRPAFAWVEGQQNNPHPALREELYKDSQLFPGLLVHCQQPELLPSSTSAPGFLLQPLMVHPSLNFSAFWVPSEYFNVSGVPGYPVAVTLTTWAGLSWRIFYFLL